MCLADLVDYGYASRVESESEYAPREALVYLQARGYEFWEDSTGWFWMRRGFRQPTCETKELAIISAFVHLAHNRPVL